MVGGGPIAGRGTLEQAAQVVWSGHRWSKRRSRLLPPPDFDNPSDLVQCGGGGLRSLACLARISRPKKSAENMQTVESPGGSAASHWQQPMTEASPNLATLLRHQEWVRALARSLVADPARADDVAQQTMLEAMTRAPQALRAPQAWLAQVARNAANALFRQEQRRRRREQVVATATADATAPDPAIAVQRAEAHKRVVDALFTVPEPYHTVLVLRYFEDLGAQEIARRLGRPEATVRTQLQRGLERMRQQLDGEFGGDRHAWCTMLMPLWGGQPAAVGVAWITTIGALLMTKWILSVAAALAAALAVAFLLLPDFTAAERAPSPSGVDGTGVVAQASPPPRPTELPEATQRDAVANAPQEVAATPPAGGLRGRVVNLEGAALPGLVLAHQRPGRPQLRGSVLVVGDTSVDLDQPGLRELLQHDAGALQFAQGFGSAAGDVLTLLRGKPLPRPRVTTDAAGRFAFDAPVAIAELVVDQPDLMLYGTGKLPDDEELLLVVGAAVAAKGQVRDEAGLPVGDAYVSYGYQISSLPGFAARLRSTSGYRSGSMSSDAEGRFDLGLVPVHPLIRLTIQKRGFELWSLATTEIRGPLACTLRPAIEVAKPRVSGIVRLVDGLPAAGAMVNFGQDSAVCAEDGSFALVVTSLHKEAPLTAWLPDLQPCIVSDLGRRLHDDATAGEQLELQLGPAALRITGVVLDAGGKPMPRMRLLAIGSTLLGSSTEFLEHRIGGQGTVESDNKGRFEMRGLSARDYVLRAIDPRTLLVIESAPIAAGTAEVVLRQPEGAFLDRVEGRVVDRFGQPVRGVSVWLSTPLVKGPNFSSSLPRNNGVTTDQQGRFVVRHCPHHGVQLVFGGDGIVRKEAAVPGDGLPLQVQITRELRFRLQSPGSVPATAFEVRDEAGVVLQTTELRPNVQSAYQRVPIRGEPVTFVVEDTAVRIVLFAGERELLAQPLVLRVGDVAELAY